MKNTFLENLKHNPRLHLYMVLAFSVGTSLILELARISITGHASYIFLIWNLFLACIPLWTTMVLRWQAHLFISHFAFWMAVAFWLLFFPNSPYLITDFVHLRQRPGVPLWFDILLLMSFAWNGLVVGLISLMEIHSLIMSKYKGWIAWSFVFTASFLGGFGIYLGRVLRWNSWDILTNPFDLMLNILNIVVHPLNHLKAWGMTSVFALFLLLAYLTLHLLSKAALGAHTGAVSHD
jgi:uncharacterized membrane protein